MARNNKRNNNKKNSSIPEIQNKTPVKSNKLLNGLLNKVGIDMPPELEAKLNEEQKIELQGLTELLQESIAKNNQTQLDIEAKGKELASHLSESLCQRQKLKIGHKEIATLRVDINLKAENLVKREADCLKIEEELVDREVNAQAGFAIQRKTSLDKFKSNISEVQSQLDKLEEDKLSLEVNAISNQRKQKIEFEKQLQEQLRAEVESLNLERSNLEKFQEKLKSDKIELNKLKLQYNLEQDNQKRAAESLRIKLTNEFKLNEQQLTQEIESLSQNRERDLDKIKLLQQKISGYKELEHEATIREFAHPSDVLAHLDNVEQELKQARSKLKGRSESDLEDDLEHYKELAEEKSESLEQLQQDYQEARSKVAKNTISVREKLELQTQKDVLELHNQTLKVSIDSLKATLDDLIEKQQSQKAFNELIKMDRKFAEPRSATSISSLKEFTEELQHRIAKAENGIVLYYDINDIRKFVAGLAMSQLHVFEGISGTGKTSLVKAFAKAVGGYVTTVPVQAGWRDRDDLIGHYNAFEKRYYEKECLQGIYRAHTPSYTNRFNIILLDEMNLSRPEQYFAEFLSALEMRDGERNIVLMDSSTSNSPKYFVEERKIPLANNTWFMGTANHDETTFEFADKTHDRSFMMELKRQHKPKGWQPKEINKDPIDIESVTTLFAKAKKSNQREVTELLNKLKSSEFSKLLEKDFSIGWGNRFEVQARSFISVYIECGGSSVEALEHLLITRVFRKGKVLGRFDISQNKIERLSESLEQLLGNSCIESSDILLTESELKVAGVF
ncbi:hypothetical protein CXF72_07950 [Psychromonas sp. MB-3u-54]|uniref:AAA family ATPase n=1 Tax=Psychromonas sp. MB-3u-54 TaxID=2058319 RepID=UPI000C33D7DA|nr:AAA family ATPase [Psychromonas sp. MB-3u-54]PKH03110.1 hypothetical protein CXF72_07950 [Psychromonas sp. MB-3u-54]